MVKLVLWHLYHAGAVAQFAPSTALIPPHDRAVRVGQCVLALGNVLNWGIGVFAGVVSLSTCEGCPAGATGGLLTDIATPPGLSGGALVAAIRSDASGATIRTKARMAASWSVAAIIAPRNEIVKFTHRHLFQIGAIVPSAHSHGADHFLHGRRC